MTTAITTAITTVQQAAPRVRVNRFARRLGATLATLGDLMAAWSAPHDEKGIGQELEAMPPGMRLDAALRWHARHGRVL